MAREESDREDLIADAVALVNRAEFAVKFIDDPVVVGYRKDGSVSFYFGQDEVYQFNSRLELRRGHLQDQLIKSENGTLYSMVRKRTDSSVKLVSRPFSEPDTDQFLQQLAGRLQDLRAELASGLTATRQVREDDHSNLESMVLQTIDTLLDQSIKVARKPGLKNGKR